MKSMRNYFKLSVVVLSILFYSCNDNRQVAESRNNGGLSLTSIQLSTLDGQPVDWKQYGSKVLFINIWATWCKPCLQEMPSIQRMMENFKNENIVFLFASDETPELIEGFKNENKFPFNYVRLLNPEEINIMALPTTFIFNAKGELAFSEMGFRKWDNEKNIEFIKNTIDSK